MDACARQVHEWVHTSARIAVGRSVERFHYSKRIITVSGADLSQLFVDFRL